jgi:hypothetical protein
MKKSNALALLALMLFISWKALEPNWIEKQHKYYNLFYTNIDKNNTSEYQKIIDKGIASVNSFFNQPYTKKFSIYIHSSRISLDSSWQRDWNEPNFKSECWMVASGIATKLDMISPKLLDKLSCEHKYAETQHTQQLITHELVHVYHGQLNSSPDFSNVQGIDWFVEGLATFASGQCDSTRIAEIKKAIAENTIPKSLDAFWTGKIKYGLSGSVVQYIDQHYGRAKLKALLPLNTKQAILSNLQTTESDFLNNWRKYILNL